MPRPAAVASSTEQLARQLFALANTELRELSKSKDWPSLQTEFTFTATAGVDTYYVAGAGPYTGLPADFRKLIINTAYRTNDFWRVRGSLTASQWQRQRNIQLGLLDNYALRIGGNPRTLRLVPTPQTDTDLVYEYTTKNFVAGEDATAKEAFVLDTDAPVVDEALFQMGLKWRIKHAKGLDYAEDFNSYMMARERTYAEELALDTICVGSMAVEGIAPGYVPDNGFGQV